MNNFTFSFGDDGRGGWGHEVGGGILWQVLLQCEIYSSSRLLFGPRGISGQPVEVWASGCCRFFLCFFYLAMSAAVVAAGNPFLACITEQDIDWIISVSADSNVAYTDPLQLAARHRFPPPVKKKMDRWKAWILRICQSNTDYTT